MSLVLGIFAVSYLFLLLFLVYGYLRLPEDSGKTHPNISFSIVIPFRNEEQKLPFLLETVAALQYPVDQFEIILINDFSEDNSRKICEIFQSNSPQLQIQILENDHQSKSPKKDAITKAVAMAKGDYILTTDADCLVPVDWLHEYNTLLMKNPAEMVAGPVSMIPKDKPLSIFQELDMFSLQTATVGSFWLDLPFMCNGANLCYQRSAFLKVRGFEGNDHIASGDDLFLLHKFKEVGMKSTFLKSKKAIVLTSSQPDIKSLISQRIRWASKTTRYKSTFGKLTGFVVLLMNSLILFSFPAYGFDWISMETLFLIFLMKFILDAVVIFFSARFFAREKILKNYIWSSMIYPFFCCYVAFASLLVSFDWKGRRFTR